ncbi:toxin-activating lysine-acyltransferase [Acinetobacter sp. ANC 4558]|uniref:toxin-activating lysine-acyltransferase n=1 Tax=Acinetobacter sp. ANC 4558 TaxID=1977876 RepID=UPI00148AD075|nr:toxin-activating lysine-acyltransferase [Acinetobacter sp. ANC 4558]
MKIGNISVIAPSHYPVEHWSEAEVLGSLVWLWQYVPSLKNAPLSYFMSRTVPFLQYRQFAVFIENERVIGYVSWAFLDEAIEQKYIQNLGQPLAISEWKSGDRLWIIDWFAPFGHSKGAGVGVLTEYLGGKVVGKLGSSLGRGIAEVGVGGFGGMAGTFINNGLNSDPLTNNIIKSGVVGALIPKISGRAAISSSGTNSKVANIIVDINSAVIGIGAEKIQKVKPKGNNNVQKK